jgi:biopolymer transport protein ExbD
MRFGDSKNASMCVMVCPMFALRRSHSPNPRSKSNRYGSLQTLLLVPIVVPLLTGTGLSGCNKSAEESAAAAATEEAGRRLVDMELPVSLRTGDPQPVNAHELEATSEGIRVGNTSVVKMEKGFVAPEEVREGVITKLETALRGAGKTTIALRLEAIVPYETLALILNTAKQVGVNNAAFQVREVGNSSKTGWIAVDNYVMASKADDVPPIQTVNALSWDDFTGNWDTITKACRTAPSGNCAYADKNFARGGTLKIELHTSGRGLNINFFRRGLTPAQEHDEEVKRTKDLAKKKEAFLQGHISHDEMIEYLLLGDPSTQALFQFRYQEALASPSALTDTIGALCHKQKCPIEIAADKISPMVRVVSLIGASFPNGLQQPAYAFEMPWTKRPTPTGLPEWASRELEQNAILDGKIGPPPK